MDLSNFLKHVKEEGLDLFNLVIYQNDQIIAEKHWRTPERIDIRSGTKSFCSTAAGFAASEGLFSLEDSVIEHFPNDLPEHPSEYLKRMKLRHLLTMTMGFGREEFMGAQREHMQSVHDWVKYALSREVVYNPGDKYLYNNIGPYLIGVLIQRKTGGKLSQYLKPRLFDPLGIHNIDMREFCPMGYEFAASGLMLDVYEFSRLGLLYLHHGIWNGKQVLPAGWAEEATCAHTYTLTTKTLPGYEIYNDNVIGATYGYFFWIGPWGKWYYACGAHDQLCVVVPEKQAVITTVGHVTQKGDRTIHLIAEDLIPVLPSI